MGAIVRVLEGDLTLVDCDGPDGACIRSADCLTRRVWMEAAKAMHIRLDAITLADLVRGDIKETPAGEWC